MTIPPSMLRRTHNALTNAPRLRASRLSPHAASAIGTRLQHSWSAESPDVKNVAILGGGITGLASAYYITKFIPKAKVTVYEASDRLGGWLQSTRVPVKDGTVLFEAGPRSMRPAGNGPLAAMLLQELDLAKDAIYTQKTSPAHTNRYVYYPDRLVRMPNPAFGIAENLWSMLTEPVFKTVIPATFGEYFKANGQTSDDESVGSFFARRLSQPMVDNILSAVIHGIYAGDVYQLSAKSLFPTAFRDERDSGSLLRGLVNRRGVSPEETYKFVPDEKKFLQELMKYQWDPRLSATLALTSVWTLKDGLGQLNDGLARHLAQNGNVEFKTSSPVNNLAKSTDGITVVTASSKDSKTYSHVISTLSPAHLNSTQHKATTALVPHIPTVTVMTVNLYFRTPNLHPPGFGYLIPQGTPFEQNPERALGVVFDTAYSPGSEDVDPANWQIEAAEAQQYADDGRLINVNDFAWFNVPDKPHTQDKVEKRGTKVTVMLGGHWWNGWPSFPDEKEGLQLALSVLERQLGITEQPEVWKVNLQKECIPQYTIGHEKRLKTARDNLLRQFDGRVRVAGNWMNGVGVNDCLRSAWDVVGGLREKAKATGLEHIGHEDQLRAEDANRSKRSKE